MNDILQPWQLLFAVADLDNSINPIEVTIAGAGYHLYPLHLFPVSVARFKCLIRNCSDDIFTFGPPGYTT